MIYVVAVLTFYLSRAEDRLQDYILGFGAVLGFLTGGLVAALEGGSGQVKDYVPAFITLSLFASSCIHGFIRRR